MLHPEQDDVVGLSGMDEDEDGDVIRGGAELKSTSFAPHVKKTQRVKTLEELQEQDKEEQSRRHPRMPMPEVHDWKRMPESTAVAMVKARPAPDSIPGKVIKRVEYLGRPNKGSWKPAGVSIEGRTINVPPRD